MNAALLSQKERPQKCDFCDTPIPPPPTNGTLGYATHLTGKVACYACCAWSTIAEMLRCEPGDHAPEGFYYTSEPAHDDALGKGLDSYGRVTNWPGSLEMRIYAKGRQQKGGFFSGHHRFDYAQRIYFSGPGNTRWSGTYYCTPSAGDLLRNVRRLK